jgi:hypothetical protein
VECCKGDVPWRHYQHHHHQCYCHYYDRMTY